MTRAPGRWPDAVLAGLAAAAASAVLGLLAGLLWAAVAPRPLLVAAGGGTAYVVNPETSAFITGEAWFCLLTAAGGLVCGVAGYLLAVRRYGVMPLLGLVLGGTAASVLAMWAGQQQGLAAFRARLAESAAGARLHQPLTLGGRGVLAFWPLGAALAVGMAELATRYWPGSRARLPGQPSMTVRSRATGGEP